MKWEDCESGSNPGTGAGSHDQAGPECQLWSGAQASSNGETRPASTEGLDSAASSSASLDKQDDEASADARPAAGNEAPDALPSDALQEVGSESLTAGVPVRQQGYLFEKQGYQSDGRGTRVG